jgi:hypothetical protein
MLHTITLFKSLFDTKEGSIPFDMSLLEVVERIKNGDSKLHVEKLRTLTGDEYDQEKKKSIVIMFNGTFAYRNIKGLNQHSGLMICDYDKIPENEFQAVYNEVKIIPHVITAFISPSGKGFKAVVSIPKSSPEEHSRRFKAFSERFPCQYFDSKNKDVSRACFESYDPNIYINENATVFTEISSDYQNSISERPAVLPITNETEIIKRLIKWWDKKFGFEEGTRNNNLLVLAQAFCEHGVSLDYGLNYVLNNVIYGNFSDDEATNVFKNAYNRMRSSAGTKYFEDIDKINEIRFALKSKTKEEVIQQHSVTTDVISDIEGTHDENQFWAINSKGTVVIIPIFFKTFLERRGYFKYYPETAVKPTFVKVKSNIVTITSVEIIKDDVLNYLINEPDVWNHVSKSKQLFSEQFLTMLKSIDMEMIKDTKSTAYVPFLNGVVKITSKSIELQKYISCDGFIWDNQIIKRNYIQAPIDNNFQDLVHKVSNNDTSRIQTLESTLGYLIHSYKDKQHQKAVIVNDELISDNPNGGSGKSIMINALKHFRKVVIIDGKAFDPNKGDFIYQRVDLDTQILAFDDVKKSFNFEAIFSLITEGITVNRKNKDEIFIPFERAPKVIITTNYVINGSGSSHARRRHEIEFHQYFNESRNPMDVYGRLLFDSWNADDWASFDCYMLSNLQNYLSTGLQSVKSINSEAKRVIQSTSKDFYDWAMEYEWSDTRHYISAMLSSFIEATGNNHASPKRFAQWVRLYLGYKSYTYTEGRSNAGIFVHIQVPF